MIPRIRTVQIKNYKSLASVSVDLDPFTVFVGPNGSGKSNFIDALAFVRDCMIEPPEVALNRRGGFAEIISRLERDKRQPLAFPRDLPDDRLDKYLEGAATNAQSMGFRLILELGEHGVADYAFEMAPFNTGSFLITRERCAVTASSGATHGFEVRNGRFIQPIQGIMPVVRWDRLALFAASATDTFRPVYDFLVSMGFYSINPETLRLLHEPDPGYILKRDGSNAAAVLRNFSLHGPRVAGMRDKLVQLLSTVVNGIRAVAEAPVGNKETLWFSQDIGLSGDAVFNAISMSDGTLRVLGLLLAVYQPAPTTVIGIEEPELTVHPGLLEMIFDVLKDASNEKQVLVTTHSPDILDQKDLQTSQLRVVQWREGRTLIAPVSGPDRETIKQNLYTAGELLRIDELEPDNEVARINSQPSDLFGPPLLKGSRQE